MKIHVLLPRSIEGVCRTSKRSSLTPFFLSSLYPQFSHLAWVQTDRKSGGIGDIKYPLVSDITKSISQQFSVLIAGEVSSASALNSIRFDLPILCIRCHFTLLNLELAEQQHHCHEKAVLQSGRHFE